MMKKFKFKASSDEQDVSIEVSVNQKQTDFFSTKTETTWKQRNKLKAAAFDLLRNQGFYFEQIKEVK